MKKLVGTLVALVIVLTGVIVFGYFHYERREVSKEQPVSVVPKDKSAGTTETYQFQDIESMEKATSIKEAFERIFGKERLFDDFKDSDSYSDYEKSNFNDPFNAEIKYYLNGVYKTENISQEDMFKYYPEKQYFFESMFIGLSMKPGFDTRMEMIDFLHYLQYSGLTVPHLIKEPLPEDSVKINSISPTMPEELKSFNINMKVYQQIKPGMNMPESHQGWSINSDVIEAMDFSNKEDILNSIHMYGKFEGVNPSGMK